MCATHTLDALVGRFDAGFCSLAATRAVRHVHLSVQAELTACGPAARDGSLGGGQLISDFADGSS